MRDHSEPQDMLVLKSNLIIPCDAIERFNIYIPTFIASESPPHMGSVHPREKYFLYSRASFDLLMYTFFTEYRIKRTITVVLTRDEEILQYALWGAQVESRVVNVEQLVFGAYTRIG